MISRTALLIIFFIGILFITINIVSNLKKCEPNKIIYRYIPRTFEEDNYQPVYVSDIFKNMFSQQSPWIFSIQNYDRDKQERVNAFFVSQY